MTEQCYLTSKTVKTAWNVGVRLTIYNKFITYYIHLVELKMLFINKWLICTFNAAVICYIYLHFVCGFEYIGFGHSVLFSMLSLIKVLKENCVWNVCTPKNY